jgi:hypothetical protein
MRVRLAHFARSSVSRCTELFKNPRHQRAGAPYGSGPLPPFRDPDLDILSCDSYNRHVTKTVDKLSEPELDNLRRAVRLEILSRRGSEHTCGTCRASFVARQGAEFCSGRCRTAAYRRRMRRAA